jgi:hypothetical protein
VVLGNRMKTWPTKEGEGGGAPPEVVCPLEVPSTVSGPTSKPRRLELFSESDGLPF